MSLVITSGFGGLLQFQNFAPLAPALITANLRNFWDLPQVAQTETLASAYQHLSGVQAANPGLLESLGQLVKRLNAREERTDADSFIISRLIGEWANLKDSVPPSSPPPAGLRSPVPPSPPPPSPKRGSKGRENSLMFYSGPDGKGGLFPHAWAHLTKDLRDGLKILAYGYKGKMSELANSDEIHAEFLVRAVTSWLNDLRGAVEGGAKGAGQSGLASAPSVKAPVTLIREITAFLTEAARTDSPLAALFWPAYGANVEIRKGIDRLTIMRTLLSTLEEGDRAALEDAIFGLDAAYLSFLLAPLAQDNKDNGDGSQDATVRDEPHSEKHGETLAKNIGEAISTFPLVPSGDLNASEQVNLATIKSILRMVAREINVTPPTSSVRAFLRRLNSTEILRLGPLVALIREKIKT